MIFYFNHTTGIPANNPAETFKRLMLNYRMLIKRPGLSIEKGIVTLKDPRIMVIGHLTLNDLIKLVDDKDIKRWIYSQFDKYPADFYYEFEQIYQEYNELEYSYYVEDGKDNIDATHLLAPARLGWCVLSMPTSKTWSSHEISLKCSSKCGSTYSVISFNGETDDNFNEVTKWLIKNQYNDENMDNVETRIVWLQNCVGKHEVIVSRDFEDRFRNLAFDEQKNAIGLISSAFTLNKLFPIKADNTLIKSCKGKGNEDTYELRDKGKGIRIYFQSYHDILILGGVHTKAEGIGVEQSADINHATQICKTLIRDLSK